MVMKQIHNNDIKKYFDLSRRFTAFLIKLVTKV